MSHLRRMTPASSSIPSPRWTNDISLSLCFSVRLSLSFLPSFLPPFSKTAHVPTHAHTSISFLPAYATFLSLPSPASSRFALLLSFFFFYGSKYCKFKRYVHAHAHGRNFSAPIKSDDAGRGFSIYYEISLWVYKLVNDALAPLKRTPTRTHHGKRINRRRLAELPLLFFRSLPLPFPVPLFFCATSSRVASSFIRVISRVSSLPPPFFFFLAFANVSHFLNVG